MMIVLRNPSLFAIESPELWYAIGVMNVLRNELGHGQATVLSAGDDRHKYNGVARAGWFVELSTEGLRCDTTVQWVGRSYTMLAAQGFQLFIYQRQKRVRVTYAPTDKHSFFRLEADVHGNHAESTKTAQVGG